MIDFKDKVAEDTLARKSYVVVNEVRFYLQEILAVLNFGNIF